MTHTPDDRHLEARAPRTHGRHHARAGAARPASPTLTRRSFLKLSIALGAGATAAGIAATTPARATEPDDGTGASAYPPHPVTFAVMSDLHYFAPSLYAACDDYTTAENSDRKMFRESRGILKKALADVAGLAPSLVLVPGDLTKDGERACHADVHDLFAKTRASLAEAGTTTDFLVINGNHDLNNHHGKDFSSGSAVDAERTDPAAYKSLWDDCGYADAVATFDASGTADGSLSYVARPVRGLTIIFVDTCRYNEPGDETGLAQETSGHVGSDYDSATHTSTLLTWVLDQAAQARAAGDVVLAVQHHGVVPHFADEPTLMGEYLVEDYPAVAAAYARAGISAVFTGHMHANDIAAATYDGATIYDVETGSLVTYPSYLRTGKISFSQKDGEVTAELTVDVHALGHVDFEGCGNDGTSTDDITDYGSTRTLTTTSVQTMAGDWLLAPYVDQIAKTGVKAALAGLLAGKIGDGSVDGLDAALWSALTAALPATRETGLVTQFSSYKVSIWYSADKQRLYVSEAVSGSAASVALALDDEAEADVAAVLAEASAAETGEAATVDGGRAVTPRYDAGEMFSKNYVYITENSFANFLDALFAQLDAHVFRDTTNTWPALKAAIALALAQTVDEEGTIDVLRLADTCYQAHLKGNEAETLAANPWVDACIERFRTGGALKAAVAGTVAGLLASNELKTLAKTVAIDLNALLWAGNIAGSAVRLYLVNSYKSLGDLLGMLAGSEKSLGETVAGLVPDSLNDLVVSALSTLSHDDNVAKDHAYAITTSATDPDWKPETPVPPTTPDPGPTTPGGGTTGPTTPDPGPTTPGGGTTEPTTPNPSTPGGGATEPTTPGGGTTSPTTPGSGDGSGSGAGTGAGTGTGSTGSAGTGSAGTGAGIGHGGANGSGSTNGSGTTSGAESSDGGQSLPQTGDPAALGALATLALGLGTLAAGSGSRLLAFARARLGLDLDDDETEPRDE